MSWWDYGHWITEIAHRIPNANPFQAGASDAGQFFTAQDESSANAMLDRLGSRYVIIDYEMAMAQRKFYAMPLWAGKSESEFFDYYYQKVNGVTQAVLLYYPAYYQSMCSRLYNFGGKKVVPYNTTYVISYQEDQNGYKILSSAKLFTTYEEAKTYLDSQSSPNYRIVGNDPFNSPVPLDKLEHYTLVHQSPTPVVTRGEETISYVEIFKSDP
jgi:asparagine N-glycosylation enzyme membrane subunit Stt3